MRVGRKSRTLSMTALLGALGCNTGPGRDYFTFLLEGVPDDARTVNAYFYVVWQTEPTQDLGQGCFLHEFDFVGQSERTITEARLTDSSDQPTNTFVSYDADEGGNPVAECLNQLNARFSYDGVVYNVQGTVVRDFAQVRTLSIGENDPSFIRDGTWTIEGMPGETGAASFWAFEQGPEGAIRRHVHPTGPDQR